MLREQAPQLRSFLPVKDWLVVGIEAGAIGAAAIVAGNLGLTETYANLWLSFTQAGVIADNLPGLFQDIFNDPENLKPALMFAGFIAGVVTDLVYSADTLIHLAGKVRFSGTNTYTISDDGVRERDRNCVDGRLDQAEQEKVEPGAGQMGGAFINNNILAILIDKFSDGPVADFAAGYYLGRTLPTALLSSLFTLGGVMESWINGPVRENQLPHDHACGWSGTENMIKHWLKFSHDNHEFKAQLLDAWNKLDEFTNSALWEPMMNIPAFILSVGRFRNSYSFGRTPIND